jgi:aminopeptidase YwaD
MYKWLFIFLMPISLFAQSKKKKLQLAALACKHQQAIFDNLVGNLQQHIGILASDSFEGRRSGSNGANLAINYIANYFETAKLQPTSTNNYIQNFNFNEGLQYKNKETSFLIQDTPLLLEDDFFPFAFSKQELVVSNATMSFKEPNEVWFFDVANLLQDNLQNPHFSIESYLKKYAKIAYDQHATGLIVYNSNDSIVDNIFFDKNDTSSQSLLPIIYIKKQAIKKYFNDVTATYKMAFSVKINKIQRNISNVVGIINNNANKTIVIGAHYDHLGFGEDKNALDTLQQIHNGADDNASGCAAMLELIPILKQEIYNKANYIFIGFGGEELGLLGSKYWLQHPTINTNIDYMINLDMVGRYDSATKLTIGGFGTTNIWGNVLPNIASNLQIKFDSTGSGPSDHASFYKNKIPVLFFFTGSHKDYHKTSDKTDKINFIGTANIVNYIATIVANTKDSSNFSFVATKDAAMGNNTKFTVSLGIMPDYSFLGNGVKIDAIIGNKIASKIGLQSGDILQQLGSYKFNDVNSYMQILAKFKKGDNTKLIIKRGEEGKEFDIVF